MSESPTNQSNSLYFTEMLTQQELEERLELRRRIRRKKNRGQGKVRETLAERIQNQRQSLIHGQVGAALVLILQQIMTYRWI